MKTFDVNIALRVADSWTQHDVNNFFVSLFKKASGGSLYVPSHFETLSVDVVQQDESDDGEKPEWDYKVVGSDGYVLCDETGTVVYRWNNAYHDLVRIDLEEYRQYWDEPVPTAPDTIDILDVAYWNQRDEYVPANDDWRKDHDVRRGANIETIPGVDNGPLVEEDRKIETVTIPPTILGTLNAIRARGLVVSYIPQTKEYKIRRPNSSSNESYYTQDRVDAIHTAIAMSKEGGAQ